MKITRVIADGARAGLQVFAYTSATVLGLGLLPALVMLTDRGTFLRWSNDILNLISR